MLVAPTEGQQPEAMVRHRKSRVIRALTGTAKATALAVLSILLVIAVLNAISTVAIIGVSEVRRTVMSGASARQLASLPNYRGREAEGRQIALDMRDLGARYVPLAGYRSAPYETNTISVGDDGRRFDPAAPHVRGNPIAFYGGSTVWGYAESDGNTFPAIFARINHVPVLNEGEIGYTTRQELGWLISNLSKGYAPRAIVFYDGVNDVNRCDSVPAHGSALPPADLEKSVELLFNYRKLIPGLSTTTVPRSQYGMVLLGYFYPSLLVMDRALSQVGGIAGRLGFGGNSVNVGFQCATNAQVAGAAAQGMVADLQMAQELAAARGIPFISILQPNIYVGRARTDRMVTNPVLGENYRAFYAAVRSEMAKAGATWFVDMSGTLDEYSNEYLYADYCHLTARGNELIASKITDLLAQKLGVAP